MRKRNGPKAVPMPALSRENTPPNLNLHELQDIPATLILSEESPKKAVLRARASSSQMCLDVLDWPDCGM